MFYMLFFFFFFNDTATTEIYTSVNTLSLHDALPISAVKVNRCLLPARPAPGTWRHAAAIRSGGLRVEEVAQPLAQEGETEHVEGDRAARKDGEQCVQGKKVLRLLQHEPPRGIGRLRAEREVGEGRFGQDRYGKARRRLDDERRERVRQDVPGDEM